MVSVIAPEMVDIAAVVVVAKSLPVGAQRRTAFSQAEVIFYQTNLRRPVFCGGSGGSGNGNGNQR